MRTEAQERTLANLKPWKKGQSGNPGGRPVKRPWTENYIRDANSPIPEELRLTTFTVMCVKCVQPRETKDGIKMQPTGRIGVTEKNPKGRKCPRCHGLGRVTLLKKGATWAQAESLRLHMEGAAKANVAAIREMADRSEGCPPQRVEIATEEVRELRFVVRYEDGNQRPEEEVIEIHD